MVFGIIIACSLGAFVSNTIVGGDEETFFGIIYKYKEDSKLQKRIRYDAENIYSYFDTKYFAMSLGFN